LENSEEVINKESFCSSQRLKVVAFECIFWVFVEVFVAWPDGNVGKQEEEEGEA
jgi:hypothetical protein